MKASNCNYRANLHMLAIMLSILAVPAAVRADSLMPLNGGSFDGLRVVIPNRAGGFRSDEFVPGYDQPSPPPAHQAAAIHALLKALYAGDESSFSKQITETAVYNGGELDWHGKNGASPDVPLNIGVLTPLATVCVDADYWKMKNGDARISWICAGRLAYISLVSFSDAKISAIKTRELPALMFAEPK